MNTIARKTALTLLATLSLVTLAALPAVAETKLLLVSPGAELVPDYPLPRFGFSSFNIGGVGERVTFVRWGGLASRFGLEPGDIILSMNDVPLTYSGSWNDALRHAIDEHGGWVSLRIRDVRTGHVARRQMFVGGGNGPIVHHSTGNGPFTSHNYKHMNGGPIGPNTKKLTIGEDRRFENNRLRNFAKLGD